MITIVKGTSDMPFELFIDCAFITYFRYMHRRCKFLDDCPAFNYNMGRSVPGAEDTSRLGSTLMRAMLKEVADFCNPEILKNWSCKPHQQVSEPKWS